VQGGRPAADRDGVGGVAPVGHFGLEGLKGGAAREAARAQHLQHPLSLVTRHVRPGKRECVCGTGSVSGHGPVGTTKKIGF
jgi:hypothetical protein